MAREPADTEVDTAILDAAISMETAADGSTDQQALITAAMRRGVFAKHALTRHRRDHGNGTMSEGETYNAIEDGLALLGRESVTWLLEHGHLTETAPGRLRLGPKPYKINGKPYQPGSQLEEELFHSIRRVSPKRKALIEASMATLGDLRDYFPVLLDENGDVVDGRHRLAIDPAWPVARIRVPAEKRHAAAIAANRSNAWSQDDWSRLRHHVEFEVGKQATSAKLAELALKENANRSDREIARLTGASQPTVGRVRKLKNFISFSEGKGGRPEGSKDAKPRIKGTPEQRAAAETEIRRHVALNEKFNREELAERHGVGKVYVRGLYQQARRDRDTETETETAEPRNQRTAPVDAPELAAPAPAHCAHCCPVHCPEE